VPSAKDFRRIALGLQDVVEGAHMGHPDFRVNGRIFATLHHDDRFGMVKLTPDQQQKFKREHPATFAPESGAWGRAGSTSVRLESADEDMLGEALTLAWQNTVKAREAASSRPERTIRKTIRKKGRLS
jgi:YjbR